MTRDDLIAALAGTARARRLHVLLSLVTLPSHLVAERAGITRRYLNEAAAGRRALSLSAKLRLARVVRVPAAVVWPELQTLALELLHGWRTKGERHDD